MGEEEPEAVRLQRHQGRHVRRRASSPAGSRPSAATPTSSRRAPTTPPPRRPGTRRSPTSRSSTQNVVITPGNAGTLDMLNRGEIAMGPVWVDMFYTWKADGKLPPNMKLKLVAPGMPGQPMYYAVPAKAGQAKLAAGVHRARHEPRGAGRRHRQAVQLVSGHRRQEPRRQARPGGLEEALRRHLAGRSVQRRASRSRSRPTSTTSSKPTRRRSRTDVPNADLLMLSDATRLDRGASARTAVRASASRPSSSALGSHRRGRSALPSDVPPLAPRPPPRRAGAGARRGAVPLSARLLARRRVHGRTASSTLAHFEKAFELYSDRYPLHRLHRRRLDGADRAGLDRHRRRT